MSEQDTQQQPQPEDVPHDDDIDVEGPNESAPGHNPPDADAGSEASDEDGSA